MEFSLSLQIEVQSYFEPLPPVGSICARTLRVEACRAGLGVGLPRFHHCSPSAFWDAEKVSRRKSSCSTEAQLHNMPARPALVAAQQVESPLPLLHACCVSCPLMGPHPNSLLLIPVCYATPRSRAYRPATGLGSLATVYCRLEAPNCTVLPWVSWRGTLARIQASLTLVPCAAQGRGSAAGAV